MKRWFELGRAGLLMRDAFDSDQEYLLSITLGNPAPGSTVFLDPYYGSPYIRLEAAFVAEYGFGEFAGNVRLRNIGYDEPNLCLQAPDDFEAPRGLQEPLMAACDPLEPRQVSTRVNPLILIHKP